MKAYRRGHPFCSGPPPSPFGHEFCGIDVATGRRVVAANSAPCGACAACRRGEETLCESLLPLLNGAYAEFVLVPERIARVNLLPVPRRHARPSSRPWSSRLPAACTASRQPASPRGDAVAVIGARADRADALRVCCRRRRSAGRGRQQARAPRPRAALRRRDGRGAGADVVIEAAGTPGGVATRARARPPRRDHARLRRPSTRDTRARSTRIASTTRR